MRTEISNSLIISERISIPLNEIEFSAIRASGPGGQSVNKTSSAVELRFAVASSSLPENVKSRLFRMNDRRLNNEGIIVIKSSVCKSQKRNKEEALKRLTDLIRRVTVVQKKRIATKPSRASVKKRLENKARRGVIKANRKPVSRTED